MVQRTTPTPQLPSLPTNRAFVVQFRASTDGEPPRYEGRIEHLISGQTVKFQSWQQLQAFIEQVLAEVPERPP